MSNSKHDKAFTKNQIAKIGNTIIYLSQHITDLSKTKILKILYLLEEASIKKYGCPFFGIDFQLWKHGPVAKDIFIDLSDTPNLLRDYVKRSNDHSASFEGLREFSDDEFSDNDIEILDAIIGFVKDKNASYLVNHTHGANSLWRQSAIQEGVLELLEQDLKNSTESLVNFSLLFTEKSFLSEKYEAAKENLEFSRHLKS